MWVGDLLLHKKASATILNTCEAQLLESSTVVLLVDGRDARVIATKPGAFLFFWRKYKLALEACTAEREKTLPWD